ncbi:hypothetical protein [Halococcus salifodinae]|uniref:Uncharacterized protein n=1 Tax=Halococcus salifodinae DSM 8989 TaxID=1227456 RepID=M0N4Z3_9EURY|nr:hypothetical protein [Halococcus salifodinae]EMA52189.1 hypothetical protein C450_11476 [Halococcus salifodinae DSM 8989]
MADSGGNQQQTTRIQQSSQPSFVIRALWYLLVGWWATGIWLGISWLLNLTIIGIPLGIKMINMVPKVLTLKSTQNTQIVTIGDTGSSVEVHGPSQRSLVVRGVYFLLVGWWASGIWMALAWLVSLTIVGLPLAIWMYNMLPAIVSLYRY